MLIGKLLNKGFLLVKLKSSLRKFYEYHNDLVGRYGIYVSKITMNVFQLSRGCKYAWVVVLVVARVSKFSVNILMVLLLLYSKKKGYLCKVY
jgi:hypothetical protein